MKIALNIRRIFLIILFNKTAFRFNNYIYAKAKSSTCAILVHISYYLDYGEFSKSLMLREHLLNNATHIVVQWIWIWRVGAPNVRGYMVLQLTLSASFELCLKLQIVAEAHKYFQTVYCQLYSLSYIALCWTLFKNIVPACAM